MKIKDIDYKRIICVVCLIVLCLIIFYTRLKNLGLAGLTGDEIVTAEVPFFRDRRCYIYAFLMNNYARFISFFTGTYFLNEVMLRLPSAIAAFLTIPFLFSIGKRIKNEFTGILLIAFFTYSSYLIGYAKDARFYSMYFLASCIVIWSVIPILNNTFKNRKEEYLYYLIYAFSMIFCMGIHQGSYLFYAFSNVFLGILVSIDTIKAIKRTKIVFFLFDYFIKILILALPLFACLWHLYKISKGQMANDPSANYALLPVLSYKTLNILLGPFYQRYPLAGKIFLISIFFSILLISSKHYRKISMYCAFVKFGSLLILHYLPQSVVKEPLREKYILYILSCDFVLIACGFSLIFDIIIAGAIKLLCLITKKQFAIIPDYLYLLAVIVLSSFLLVNTRKNIQIKKTGDVKAEVRTMANHLNGVSDDDIIIIFGSYKGINHAFDYESKRYESRKNWRYYSNPQSYKWISKSKASGYVWYVFGEASLNDDEYTDIIYSEGALSVYKSKARVSENLEKIGVMTAEILKTADSKNGTINSFIKSVSSVSGKENLLSDAMAGIPKTKIILSDNLLKNGDFEKGLKYWNTVHNISGISIGESNGDKFVTLTCLPGKVCGVVQNINVSSGHFYRISATVRNNKNHKNRMLGAYLNIFDFKTKNSQYIVFYDGYNSWTTKTYRLKCRESKVLNIQAMMGFGNIPEETIADFSEVSVREEIGKQKIDRNTSSSNIIKNGTFTNDFNCWRVAKYHIDVSIEHDQEIGENYLLINNTNGLPSFASQNFNVISGMIYNISCEIKYNDSSVNAGGYLVLTGFAVNKDKEQYLFMPKLDEGWNKRHISIKSLRSGLATLRLNTGHNKTKGTVMFKNIDVQEIMPLTN